MPGLGWYWWDGRRWRQDDDGEALRRAKQAARSILTEAQHLDDHDARKALLKWSVTSETKPRLEAAVSLAESDLAVILRADQLDNAPGLLTVQNGTVDLRTGELRDHAREDRITQMVDLEYLPGAQSALWARVLERACGRDPDMSAFVQRLAGYTATGEASEDVLGFLHGPGATAKTTVIEAVKNALGEYAATADFETFLRQHGDAGIRNDIARLVGKRIVVSVEVDEGRRLAESLVKSISGGDRITARFLYREAFEFRPAFVLWLVANARPYVNAADEGIWRRIVQIPFLTVIPESERDPTLRHQLRDPEHAQAILAWIVQGAIDYYAHGLNIPQKVRDYTADYRHESDPLADWLADCAELDPDAQTSTKDLRNSYEQWAEANGERPIDAKKLAAAFKARGHTQTRTKTGRYWTGIRLATQGGDDR